MAHGLAKTAGSLETNKSVVPRMLGGGVRGQHSKMCADRCGCPRCRNVLHVQTDVDLHVAKTCCTRGQTRTSTKTCRTHGWTWTSVSQKLRTVNVHHNTWTSISIMSFTPGCPLHANPSPHFPNPPQLLFSNCLAAWSAQSYKYHQQHVEHLQHPPLFIEISTHSFTTFAGSLSSCSFLPTHPHSLLMKTRTKSKSKHPAAPIMTPGQLAAAGIPQPQKRKRQPTKDQRIAALEEDLRATRELLRMVCVPFSFFIPQTH